MGRRFQGLGSGARDLGRVILARQQTRIGTDYSRPPFVSSSADVAGTAAFAAFIGRKRRDLSSRLRLAVMNVQLPLSQKWTDRRRQLGMPGAVRRIQAGPGRAGRHRHYTRGRPGRRT